MANRGIHIYSQWRHHSAIKRETNSSEKADRHEVDGFPSPKKQIDALNDRGLPARNIIGIIANSDVVIRIYTVEIIQ